MVYFIRHGERHEQIRRAKHGIQIKDVKKMSDTAREKYYNQLERKNLNDSLTAKGKRETRELAKILKRKNISVIYTSPFKRCVQTAEIIAKDLGINFIIDERFKERGAYNHIRHFDEKEFNYLWDNYLNYNFYTPYIETAREFVDRIKLALDEIKQKHANENVLIVGHSCLTYAINTAVGGVPKSGFIPHDSIDNNDVRIVNY